MCSSAEWIAHIGGVPPILEPPPPQFLPLVHDPAPAPGHIQKQSSLTVLIALAKAAQLTATG